MTPIRPISRRILDAVIPPTARWLVALMRTLEEHELNAETRWDFLKRRLTVLGRDQKADPIE